MAHRRRDSIDSIIDRAINATKTDLSADSLEKRAGHTEAFVVPLAKDLFKVASALRSAPVEDVTYADVYAFARKMVEGGHV